MVIWITGMSGAGKSALASETVRLARARGECGVLLVDGDVLREVFGGDLGYSEDDRRRNMVRMARLCRWLDNEGVHAVAAVVAPFRETREWCREHIPSYFEVHIDAPLEQLVSRDPKGHYARALAGKTGLPGVNQTYETPESPDLLIRNAGSLDDLLAHATTLADRLPERMA